MRRRMCARLSGVASGSRCRREKRAVMCAPPPSRPSRARGQHSPPHHRSPLLLHRSPLHHSPACASACARACSERPRPLSRPPPASAARPLSCPARWLPIARMRRLRGTGPHTRRAQARTVRRTLNVIRLSPSSWWLVGEAPPELARCQPAQPTQPVPPRASPWPPPSPLPPPLPQPCEPRHPKPLIQRGIRRVGCGLDGGWVVGRAWWR